MMDCTLNTYSVKYAVFVVLFFLVSLNILNVFEYVYNRVFKNIKNECHKYKNMPRE